MRYALMTEPQQGYRYQDIVDAAVAAKTAGFETYFRSDHYSSFPGEEGQPATDCWTTLAGLVRDTDGIGVGSMVSPVTFRIPGSFAKVVATVVEMAGDDRVELGVGAGWNQEEHAALGIPYPGTVERVDRMEEELAILRGLWDEPDGWSFQGQHWQVQNALFRPRGPRPNLIVGGVGRPRSVRLGAQFADEYNISSSNPAEVREVMATLDAACEKFDRDPGRSLARSWPACWWAATRPSSPIGASGRSPSSVTTPTARPRGWRRAATAGSWARPTRPGPASRNTGLPVSTGSSSRTSCRRTWTRSPSWVSSSARPAGEGRPGVAWLGTFDCPGACLA